MPVTEEHMLAYLAGIEHTRGVLHAEVLAMRDQQRRDFSNDRHKVIALLMRLSAKLMKDSQPTASVGSVSA